MAITARIGIEPIPCDANSDGSFSEYEYTMAVRRTVLAGVDNLSYSVAWSQFETSEGVYDTTVLGWINAARGSAKLQVTIAVLDFAGNKNLPTYLVGNALDSSAVKTAFRGVIDRLHTLLGADGLDILALGNEVEAYLATHTSEITPYADLIADAKTYARAKTGWPAVQVTTSFKHKTLGSGATATAFMTLYGPVISACTLPGFTYYPINEDATVQYTDPDDLWTPVVADLLLLPTGVANTVILTEVGFPSHPDLNSSEVLQASFMAQLPAMVQFIADFDGIYSAQIQWLTDWPDWLLDHPAFGFTGNLRKFVGSLGIRTERFGAKTAWGLLVTQLGGTAEVVNAVNLVGRYDE